MRSKGHVYVVAESMYSDRPRIPMNPYTMKAHLLRTSAFNQGGPWDGPIRLRAPLYHGVRTGKRVRVHGTPRTRVRPFTYYRAHA